MKPEDVGAYAVLEEEPQLDWGLPEVLGASSAKERAAIRVEKRCQVFFIRPGGQLEAEDAEAEDVEEEAPPVQDPSLEHISRMARERWMERARRGDWGGVRSDMSVYEVLKLKEDPQMGKSYADQVVEVLGIMDPARRPHLSAADRAAAEEVFRAKAACFWIDGTPRTIIRGVTHHVRTIGGRR